MSETNNSNLLHYKLLYSSQGIEDHRTYLISYATLEWHKTEFYEFYKSGFYEIDRKIYLSNLIFYPSNGMALFEPEEYEFKFGYLIKLPLS